MSSAAAAPLPLLSARGAAPHLALPAPGSPPRWATACTQPSAACGRCWRAPALLAGPHHLPPAAAHQAPACLLCARGFVGRRWARCWAPWQPSAAQPRQDAPQPAQSGGAPGLGVAAQAGGPASCLQPLQLVRTPPRLACPAHSLSTTLSELAEYEGRPPLCGGPAGRQALPPIVAQSDRGTASGGHMRGRAARGGSPATGRNPQRAAG